MMPTDPRHGEPLDERRDALAGADAPLLAERALTAAESRGR